MKITAHELRASGVPERHAFKPVRPAKTCGHRRNLSRCPQCVTHRELASQAGIGYATLQRRLRDGMSLREALNAPDRRRVSQ